MSRAGAWAHCRIGSYRCIDLIGAGLATLLANTQVVIVAILAIDRRSGKRVFDGWPTDDPRAAVIWEAFKPDTEPRRTRRQDETDQLRELILAQLRRADASATSGGDEARETQAPGDFAEEQGGLY